MDLGVGGLGEPGQEAQTLGQWGQAEELPLSPPSECESVRSSEPPLPPWCKRDDKGKTHLPFKQESAS